MLMAHKALLSRFPLKCRCVAAPLRAIWFSRVGLSARLVSHCRLVGLSRVPFGVSHRCQLPPCHAAHYGRPCVQTQSAHDRDVSVLGRSVFFKNPERGLQIDWR